MTVPAVREHPARLARFPEGPLLYAVEELDEPLCTEDRVYGLTGARVVVADVPLVQHDFPHLREAALCRTDPWLGRMSAPDREAAVTGHIERWLLTVGAVVSEAQLSGHDVNTPIPVDGRSRPCIRPARYGRAVVLSGDPPPAPEATAGARLLDVKGVGVARGTRPRIGLHETGLMQLGEAIRDTLVQWVIEAVFWHAGSRFFGLPLYAVIDPGFDVLAPDGRPIPCGIQLRRAHRRPPDGTEIPHPGSDEELRKAEVEMLLRHYGITSSNTGTEVDVRVDGPVMELSYNGRLTGRYGADAATAFREAIEVAGDWNGRYRFDGINVQLARSLESDPSMGVVVDFGHYSHRRRFRHGVLSLVNGWPLRWGGRILPHHAHFVQPVPELAVPLADWRGDRAWRVAEGFRERRLGRDDVERELYQVLAATARRWREASDQA